MTLIIPMAGFGSRFKNSKYTKPKPFIKFNGKEMILHAIDMHPNLDDNIVLIAKYEHKNYINEINLNKNFNVITINEHTDGQATTALKAVINIKPNKPFFIGACDNGFVFDNNRLLNLIKSNDIIVFTFYEEEVIKNNEDQYSWYTKQNNVSMKKKLNSSDEALCGCFYFKNKEIYQNLYNKMKSENGYFNDELYIDNLINYAYYFGYNVSNFKVEKFLCWGTPELLIKYEDNLKK